MSFALDLQKFAEKAGRRADIAVGEIVTQIVASVDDRSPVDTGRFRGNWQLGVGQLPAGTLERLDPSGEGTVTANLGRIPEDAAGNVYYLSNNLPYAQRLEHGWSRQAPAGIVGLTVTEFQGYVDRAVASAKRQAP